MEIDYDFEPDLPAADANYPVGWAGSNDDEYAIYVACAESLGWRVKSYDDWLNS